jgi:hypothetical protein
MRRKRKGSLERRPAGVSPFSGKVGGVYMVKNGLNSDRDRRIELSEHGPRTKITSRRINFHLSAGQATVFVHRSIHRLLWRHERGKRGEEKIRE